MTGGNEVGTYAPKCFMFPVKEPASDVTNAVTGSAVVSGGLLYVFDGSDWKGCSGAYLAK